MKRRGLLAGLSAGLLAPISSAFATPIPPVKCVKVGQTTIFAGKKFTCVRVKVKGKSQLAWNKGVPIQVSKTPSPSKTQSANPSSSATPTPSAGEPKKIATTLADSSAVAVGETKIFPTKNLSGTTVTYIVHRSKNGLVVMNDICTHEGCAVKLANSELSCPCHGSSFNATTGAVERGPAMRSLQRYEVFEENGKIKVVD